MKKGTVLLLLVTVLAICAAVYCLLPQETASPEPTPEPTRVPVASIPANDIAALSWDYAARTLSFCQETGVWQYPDDEEGPFPLDRDGPRFRAILRAFDGLTAAQTLTPSDGETYGLDVPTTVITVTQTDGTETRFLLGAQNPVTGQFYLQVNGNDTIYLVDSAFADTFACGLFDLVKTDDIPNLSAATEYTVNGQTYSKNADGLWCIQNTPIDKNKSDALSNALDTLRWSACIDYYTNYYETKTDLYGLEHGKIIAVTVGDTVWQLAVGNDYDEGHKVVSPVDSTIAYTLDNAAVNALLLQ